MGKLLEDVRNVQINTFLDYHNKTITEPVKERKVIKHLLSAMVILHLDSECSGRTQEEAMAEFIRRIKNGNYDRQLLRNFLDDSKREIFVNVKSEWS